MIGEGVEVFGVDTGGGFGSHGRRSAREKDRKSSERVSVGCWYFGGVAGVPGRSCVMIELVL